MGAAGGEGSTADGIARALVEDFDWKSFEFKSAPGLPQPRALQFLLSCGLRLGTDHAVKVAVRGLDALVKSDLYDSVEGGFFEGCDRGGWKEPRTAKPLALNAQFVEALSLASREGGREDFMRAAHETVGWVERSLARTDDDLWGPGLPADDDYYALLRHARDRRGPPVPVNEVSTPDCALMVSALSIAAAASEGRPLVSRARLALQSLLDQAVGSAGEVSEGTHEGAWDRADSDRARAPLASSVVDVWCVTGDRSLLPTLEALSVPLADSHEPLIRQTTDELACGASVLFRQAGQAHDDTIRRAAEAALDDLEVVAAGRPSEAGSLGLAKLARIRGVVIVEGVAGSALASNAFGRCAAYGPAVVRDVGDGDKDENLVTVRVRNEPPRTARRRAGLDHLVSTLRAVPEATAGRGKAP